MNILLCLIALLVTPTLGYSQFMTVNHAVKTSFICWQEGRALEWGDFQAVRRPTEVDSLPGTYLVAATVANAIVYDRTTESGAFIKTFVRVEFDRSKSWVNKVDYADRQATLVHEQLHFDIAELTGRKIRRVLARCAAKHIDSHTAAITKEITRIYNDESYLQRLCDKVTKAGNDFKAQTRWQAYIKKQLDTLCAYKSTSADCQLPQ